MQLVESVVEIDGKNCVIGVCMCQRAHRVDYCLCAPLDAHTELVLEYVLGLSLQVHTQTPLPLTAHCIAPQSSSRSLQVRHHQND